MLNHLLTLKPSEPKEKWAQDMNKLFLKGTPNGCKKISR